MFKTMKYRYTSSKKERNLLRLLCHISKNLYNSAIYILRQTYFKTKQIPSYYELNKLLKTNENFHILNTYTSICIIRNAHTTFTNFIKGHTKLPKYLKQNDYYIIYTEQIRKLYKEDGQQLKLPMSNLTRTSKVFNKIFEDKLISKFIKESGIKESFDIYFKIPKEICKKTIRSLRIVPSFRGLTYDIEFTYIEYIKKEKEEKKDIIMSIDLGINNLATCVLTTNESFIIDGRKLKSINHFYNKQKAYYQSKKPDNKEYTLKEYLITSKRNRRINDLINKAAKMIIDIALQKQVKEIVIGYNKNFKTGGIKTEIKGKLKKQINQNFTQIPLSKIRQKIKEKCQYCNIIYTQINESYTSKCSFYDDEEIGYHKTYLGKRITRSLYETKEKRIINADVNGALNILKKSKTDRIDLIESLRNIGLTIPSRLKIKN